MSCDIAWGQRNPKTAVPHSLSPGLHLPKQTKTTLGCIRGLWIQFGRPLQMRQCFLDWSTCFMQSQTQVRTGINIQGVDCNHSLEKFRRLLEVPLVGLKNCDQAER